MSRYAAVGERSGLEVAIIGMACRFPGASDLSTFWRNLRDGVHSVRTFSDDELLASGVPPEVFRHERYVRANPVLEGIDLFDAGFFDIAPREVEIMDPQHRIFLECAHEALEAAGYGTEACRGPVGVYAGANINTYVFNLQDELETTESTGDVGFLIGNDKDYLASRVSYKLNLRGPSITVQTACSTSLVAVHLACRGLLSGECDLAVAGGVSVRVPQNVGYLYQEGGVHSPDGYCRAFDARAHGTMFGSGAGAVVLKRLQDALADNDCILAVVKGSAVNNDGSAKVGFTAPGLDGQAAVIRAAHQAAEVAPETIAYVEAHGTATPLGDPIEVQALTEAFGAGVPPGACAIGSVKTNVGHLVTAAGIAGLIKTVLALVHRQIPPSLHFDRPNPHIDFGNSPFYVNATLREWPSGPAPRRAGVSSFGVGGTNAHVVLEEAPARLAPSRGGRTWQIVPLSARMPAALETITDRIAAACAEQPADALPDVACTLQVGRKHWAHRRVALCRTVDEARRVLAERDPAHVLNGHHDGAHRPIVFMFPGQGSQYVSMGRELYEREPALRLLVDDCCERLRPHLGVDLRRALYPLTAGERRSAIDQLNQTAFTQPALFVLEYALARLWMRWGVRPDAMIGHSIGEYVAATVAGVFTLDDALALVSDRGRLVQGLPAGAMTAVPLPGSELLPMLEGGVGLAAENAPASSVVAGPVDGIEAFEERLAARGVRCRRLQASHAFHSSMLDPILPRFADQVGGLRLHAPRIRFVSNVTGGWIGGEASDPAYWVRHLRQPVRFSQGLDVVLRDPRAVVIEVGPGQTLRSLVEKHPARGPGHLVTQTLPAEGDGRGDELTVARAVGQIWTAGVDVNWREIGADEDRGRVPLPTYPFERARYWIETGRSRRRRTERLDQASRGRPPAVVSVPSWRRSMAGAPAPDVCPPRTTWAVFCDTSAFASALCARLQEAGCDVVRVLAGQRFARDGAGTCVVSPGCRDDYRALVQAWRGAGGLPRGVVHAWNVSDGDAAAGGEGEEASLDRGVHSLLWLAQALGEQRDRSPLDLTVVSTRVHSVAGETLPLPERAALLGACSTIPLEYPFIACRSVDVVLDATRARACERVAAQVAAECLGGTVEPIVAYRQHERWIRTFEPVDLSSGALDRPPLREGGVYIITGGTGGVGLLVAEHLARTARARLALVGRREVGADVRRRIEALEQSGAATLLLRADVTDEAQMRDALARVLERFGSVHGVFHAAGVPGGGLIALRTSEAAARVLAPKLRGTRVLERVLAGVPVDFVMLFSSTLSLSGAIGQSDYCAANAFLDAFAHAAEARGGPRIVSVNWDGWRGVGMNAPPDAHADADGARHPLEGRCVSSSPDHAEVVTDLRPSRQWVLDEHRVDGMPTLPGTALLDMVRAAFSRVAGADAATFEQVFFLSPLMVAAGAHARVRTVFDRRGDRFEFRVRADDPGGAAAARPAEFARGWVSPAVVPSAPVAMAGVLARCPRRIAVSDEHLASNPSSVVRWGPRWKNLIEVHVGEDEAVALQALPQEFAADLARWHLHPALLDVATTFLALVSGLEQFVPVSYGRITVYAPLPQSAYTHARRRARGAADGSRAAFDVTMYGVDGTTLVDVEDFVMMHESALQGRMPAAARDERPAAEGAAGARELGAETALASLDRILALPDPQVVVSVDDMNLQIARTREQTLDRLVQEAAGAAAERPGHPRPALATPYAAPETDVQRKVVEVWRDVLGVGEVGIHDNFFDLGGHSLLAAQIVDRVRQVFAVDVPLGMLLAAPTVASVAEHVASVQHERDVREQLAILSRLAQLSDEDAEAELRKHVAP